ncbi:unnamed protein product [Candidula unifasciata]|uniref:G-protein coupled receptors family 1 profile domain-containing protein n=1 Tax=Candidula unifasciata TaxID=100452 RepID=A0A8S4A594_9EUPU|nr:unnamed protein product [Candidula unifasciata]
MGDALTMHGERSPDSATQPHTTGLGIAVAGPPSPLDFAGELIDNCSELVQSLTGQLPQDADCNGSSVAFQNESSFYDLLLNHGDIKMRDDLLRYMTPVVIITGNLSNLMALFVLRRKKLRRNSVCFYMCAYAIANLLTLNLMLGVGWVCFAFNKIYVSNLTDWSCRLWSFITNVITYSGIWFVVAMNIDRLLYTLSRSGGQGNCSVFSAKAAVTAIVIGLVVVSIHAMWTFELQPHGCYVPFQQGDIHILIWPWWSATVYTYLPLFLIISLNIVHITALALKYCHELQSSSPQADGGKDSFVVTVIVVSMSFFLLAVPATVANILDIHMPSSWLSVDLVARMELTKKITEILSSLNQVVFGAQLLLCSEEFRRECVALLRVIFCCVGSKRNIKMVSIRQPSNSEDSSPERQVDYELCNNNDETITSV